MKLKAKILTIVLVLATLISIIGVFAIPASAADTKTIYLNLTNSNWTQASAKFQIYTWGGKSDNMVQLLDSDGDGIYSADVPSDNTKAIFLRQNPSGFTVGSWSGEWARTADLSISGNCFNINGGNDGWGTTGSWSTLTYYLKGTFNEWGDGNPLASSDTGLTTTINLAAGNYSFKIMNSADKWWSKSSTAFTDTTSNLSLSQNNSLGDMTIKVTKCGAYTFSFNSGKLTVTRADDDSAHTGGNATCIEKATCTVCGQSYGDLAAHTEVIDECQAPTATATGLTQGKHCSVCGEKIVAQVEIPAVTPKYKITGSQDSIGTTTTAGKFSRDGKKYTSLTMENGVITLTADGNQTTSSGSSQQIRYIPAVNDKEYIGEYFIVLTLENNTDKDMKYQGAIQGTTGLSWDDLATGKSIVLYYQVDSTGKEGTPFNFKMYGYGAGNVIISDIYVVPIPDPNAEYKITGSQDSIGTTTTVGKFSQNGNKYTDLTMENGVITLTADGSQSTSNSSSQQIRYLPANENGQAFEGKYTMIFTVTNNTDTEMMYQGAIQGATGSGWVGLAAGKICTLTYEVDSAGVASNPFNFKMYGYGAGDVIISDIYVIPREEHVHSWDTSWSYDDENHWKACKNCTAKSETNMHTFVDGFCSTCSMEEPECEHIFGDVVYKWGANNATCKATKTCTNCGTSYTQTVDTTSKNNATCTEGGTITYTATFTEHDLGTTTYSENSAALGHSFGATTEANAATCLAAGNDAYKYCSQCKLYYAGDAATDESIANGKADTTSFVLTKLDHQYTGEIKSDGNGENATHSYKCVNGCGKYGDAVKHVWNEGVVTDEPTCVETGVKTYTCTTDGCGATYTVELSATGNHGEAGCTCTLVKLYNGAGWTEAYCHSWPTSGSGTEWPGQKMTYNKEEGYYYAYVLKAHNNIIYNNGNGEQTGNLVLAENTEHYNLVIAGDFNGWETKTFVVENGVPTYRVTLEKGTSHKFKIIENGTWLGNDGMIDNKTETGWEMTSVGGNCTLSATKGGVYIFTYDHSTNKLSVAWECVECSDSTTDNDHNCDVCGKVVGEHEYSQTLSYDENNHYYACNCGDKKDVTGHTHTGEVKKDATHHWQICACGHENKTAHVYVGNVIQDETHHWQICTCGAENKTEHTYSGDWKKDDEKHWKDCDSCGYDGHVGKHNYAGEVQKDDTHHWQLCECGDTNKKEHNYIETVANETYKATDATCTSPASYYCSCECGAKGKSTFTSGDIANHVFVPHDAVEATCLTAGNEIYYTCENCTNYFTSNTDLKAAGYSYENFLLSKYYIAALGHDMQSVAAQDPTCTAVGWKAYEKCSRCDYSTYAEIPALNHKMDTTPFYRVDGGVLYQVTQCERYATCNHEVKTEASATVTVSNEADLRAVLAAGHNVKLANDITLTKGCIKLTNAGANIEIDMNEKTLTNNKFRVNDVVDVLWVANKLEVTITGNGSMKALGTEAGKTTCVISATDGATINIESGSFYSEGCTTIYATRGGTINISGGLYKAADPYYLIDINEGEANKNYGNIVITGGQFVGFNPADHTNDGSVSTNKIPDGYHSIKNENVYTVGAHNHVAGTSVPVTCTTDGYTPYTCVCGSSYNTITEKSKGHSFDDVIPQQNSTCLATGRVAYKTCKNCDKYFFADATEFAGGAAETSFNALTTAGGFVIAQLDHDYSGDIKADANGTTHSFKCVNGCNEYGAAVDHADSATDNDHKCDTCGEVLEECSDATGDRDHNCDVCGKENVSDHDWDNPTCTESSTCTECDATSGVPMGHKFTTNIYCDNRCGTKAAAQVGENYYETFAKAFETATKATESKIVLIQNVNLAAAITVSNNLTINLNGNSIALAARSGSNVINVEAGATLVFEGNGSVIGSINVDNGGTLIVKGGTFLIDVTEYVADGYVAIKDLNGNWVVGKEPTATVNNLGSMIIPEGEYYVYNGSMSGDLPLSFVMQFLANQNEEDMKTSPYADWYADFVLKFTGIEEGSFVANGCYLAGHYGDFGWVVIPVDKMIIENDENYPVMLGAGFGQKYDYVCSGVQDFRCALYISEEILEANPNLEVSLSLHLVDSAKGADKAAEALENGNTHQVVEEVYEEDYFRGPAAQIGKKEYNSLQDAVDAATDSSEIIVIRDNDSKYPVEINKNVTIDLGGYTFNGKIIVDDAEVTFTNGRVINTNTAISVENGGKLVIKSGYYEGGIECADVNNVQLLGGIYDRDVSDLCSDGYKCSINENGNYAVVATPYIGDDGYWYIGNVKTNVLAKGEDGASITIVGEPESSFDAETNSTTYTIKFSDGSTVNFTVFHGAAGADGATGADGNGIKDILVEEVKDDDGKVIGQNVTIYYTKTDAEGNESVKFYVPNGKDGADGTSVTVKGIEVKETNETSTTYTIKFSDGNSVDFTVLHGKDGAPGADGNGIESIVITDEIVDGKVVAKIITINYTKEDASGNTSVNFKIPCGIDGADGTSVTVEGIEVKESNKTSTTYTIKFSGGNSVDFTVLHGADGAEGNGIKNIVTTDKIVDGKVVAKIVTINYTKEDAEGNTSATFEISCGSDGHTPVISINDDGFWCIDGTSTGVNALGKDGKGIKSINKTSEGLVDTYTIIYTDDTEFEFTVTNGRGIVSISLTSTSADGLVDTYTITYNDGTTFTFKVTNGANGINGIQGEKGDTGPSPVVTIQNGNWHVDGVDTGYQAQGLKGDIGNGISDISKTGINGLVDTYTITYTDGRTTTFTVTNGAQGEQGIQGIQGVPGEDGHTPDINIGENGNWFIDGVDTGVKAEAVKGDDGDTPYIGENGNWWIDGKDLGIPATGDDGHTPEITIGENGNWFIDGVDTGVKAEGKDGNDNNKIIIICIGIAALCIIVTIVAVATRKFRRPWWILC